MKKIILIILIIIPFSLNANENAKEKKVAKYVMENIQRDYVNCYSFYKVAAQSFKDAGKDKNIIKILPNKRCSVHQRNLNVNYQKCTCMKNIDEKKIIKTLIKIIYAK